MESKNKEQGKAVTIVCGGPYRDKLRELKRKRLSFKMESTLNYAVFRVENGFTYKYYKKSVNFKFLSMLSSVKADIRRNLKEIGVVNIPEYSERHIRYFSFGKPLLKVGEVGEKVIVTDAMEYDATKAYFQAAHSLGYLSYEMYEKCLTVPKSDRLRLLGSIATRKMVLEYVDGKCITNGPEFKEDEAMRKVWFHVCKFVDNCMWQFKEILGEQFYMYWVDGVMFKKSALKKAEKFTHYAMVQYGLSFKIVSIDKIEIAHTETGRKLTIFKEGGTKEFDLPRNNKLPEVKNENNN